MKKPKKYPNEPNMVYLGTFFKCNLIIPSPKIHLWQDLWQDFEGECYDKLGQKDYERFSNPK